MTAERYAFVNDPFTLGLEAVWKALEADTEFLTRVRLTNRIKLTRPADPAPTKETVQAGDLPEVIIAPVAATVKPFATSTSMQIEQPLEIRVETGGLRLTTDGLFPLQWCIIKALTRAAAAEPPLGCPFLVDVQFVAASQELVGDESGGPSGWRSVITVVLVHHISRKDVLGG